MEMNNFDIFGLNETWLDDTISDLDISIPGYIVIRNDRNRRGGGVCLYIRDHLKFETLIKPQNDVESIWAHVGEKSDSFVVCCMYRPPGSSVEYYNAMIDELMHFRKDHELLLLGDLNFDYKFDELLYSRPIYHIESLFGLTQLVLSPTRVTPTSSTLIDVILSSMPERHTGTRVIKFGASDHYCVETKMQLLKKSQHQNKQCHNVLHYRDYKSFSIDAFVNDVKESMADLLSNDVPDDLLSQRWDEFKNKFLEYSDKHAPLVTQRLKNRHNNWMDHDILKLMYERDHVKEKAVKTKSSDMWDEYKRIRNSINSKIRMKKKAFYEKEYNDCKGSPKKIWKFLNKVTKKNVHDPPKGVTADEFNCYFSSIGSDTVRSLSQVDSEIPWKGPVTDKVFTFDDVQLISVQKLLSNLGDRKSMDILNIDSYLLWLVREHIAPFLTKLFNCSLRTGIFPNDWKRARVSPIYKGKGNTDDKGNYRPISVIGHLSKLFEKEVQKQLMAYLVENNFISIDQSAYRKYHNTQTSLHRVTDEWIDNICDNLLTGVCLLDIKKCFDTIDHDILLKKLSFYGIKEAEARWFKSYLTDRSMTVKCNGQLSDETFVNIGVPQGSILGPLLFTLFINDLSQHIHLGVANLYADDVLLYCTSDSVSDLNEKLQICLNDVSNWYCGNKLVLNADKSNVMFIASKSELLKNNAELNIKLHSKALEHCKKSKYLGVTIDENMNWDKHISNLCKSLYIKIAQLSRVKCILPSHLLLKIFNSTLQPCFDYGITVWGSTTACNIAKVQHLQNYAARVITGNFDYINSRGVELVKSLGWMTIKQRFYYFQAILLFKCIHGLAPDYLVNEITMLFEVNGFNTRSHDMNVYLPLPPNEFYKRKCMYNGAVIWNNLPSHLKDMNNIDCFKRHLKKHVYTVFNE